MANLFEINCLYEYRSITRHVVRPKIIRVIMFHNNFEVQQFYYEQCYQINRYNKVFDILPPSSPGFAIILAVLFPCESSNALSPKKSPFLRVLRNCSPPDSKVYCLLTYFSKALQNIYEIRL